MRTNLTSAEAKALKAIHRASDLMSDLYANHGTLERHRRARRVLDTLANALECGEAFKVTGAAEEFDYSNIEV